MNELERSGKSRTIVLNILWSVLAVIVNYGMNFAITPYVTNNIGIAAYGFVNMANTFITYVDILAVALNAFAGRYISIAYHRGDFDEARSFYSSVIIADAILGAIVAIPSFLLIWKLEFLLKIPQNLVTDVKILFAVVLFKYMLTMIRTAFDVGTFIANRLDLSERQRTVSYFVNAGLLLILCAFLPPHVWYIGIAGAAAAMFLLVMNYHYTRKLAPELKCSVSSFSAQRIKTLIISGIWNAINNLGNVLNNGLDLLITNVMLDSVAMGNVSVGKNLSTICYSLVISIANAFKPMQLKYYAENNTAALVKELKTAMKMTGLLCEVIIAGFIAFGLPFVSLWIGKSADADMVYRLSVIVLLSDIIIGNVNPLYYVFTLTNKVKLPCFVTIGMGIANVAGMYVLIRYTGMGAYAVVITTLAVNFVHLFDTPLYSAHCLKIKWTTFYPVMIRHLIACGVDYILLKGISMLMPYSNNWLLLAVNCVTAGAFGVAASVLIVLDIDERKALIRKVKQRIH